MLQEMARTLAARRSGLLAYDDVMITSGPVEGTNHKIKTMKRQAYGLRDREFFKRKILAIHENLKSHIIHKICYTDRISQRRI
jgi:transposase